MSSLGIFTNNEEITGIKGIKIPLYQGGYNQKIIYLSGVAMRISKSQNSPVMEVAEGIAGYLSQNSDSLFRVKVVPSGEIHIELMDSTLAAWLQNLIVAKKTGDLGNNFLHDQLPTLSSLNVFTIQYAHARCCSLLRLGQQEGLIELDRTDINNFIAVNSIPWLNCEQKLIFNHADESFLIHQLVKVVDDVVCADSISINWEKAGGNLSQAFERFWGSCRIWGEVKIHDLELAKARLGLLIATQLVLRSVLEDKLGIVAPVEL
ncbi:DALR anticodon-binding domain-containing protein [Dolichospermum sp. UHCC 0259]|uniref:DALR anticodon-binding domain-containing protein n=1 Tax=Dolichospermum sp. UHCC 0259 TaxID=2590010 RepID=UPI001448A150|nr:DALR anticodon-binding domain-containing protein [Dolichospermum sp. UHCC 0259]MTJ49310.1 anticodon-binding protein [Dolichospermum sp. UHCC 0259]